MSRPAVFLDRDGVLIEDVHLLTKPEQVRLISGAAAAVAALNKLGYAVIIVTNQTVIARGLCTEQAVNAVHQHIQSLLAEAGAVIDAIYVCPHHPNATLPAYRLDCDCRKPRPGMLLTAAADHNLDLKRSYLIGDRVSDIAAGVRAGVQTIQVRTGAHDAPLIESKDRFNQYVPNYICANIVEALKWISQQ